MRKILLLIVLVRFVSACAPTVALQAPEKPLEINLNVKIDHQISVKVDKQLDDVMSKNKDIF